MIDARALQVVLDAIIVNHEAHKLHLVYSGSELWNMNLKAIELLQGVIAGAKQPETAQPVPPTPNQS